MTATLEAAMGVGAVVLSVVLAALCIAWLVSLFLLVADTISVGAKIVWFVFLTCLAPFVIPLYLVLRHRRRAAAA